MFIRFSVHGSNCPFNMFSIFIFLLYIRVLPVCTVCVPGAHKGQKWSSDSLKLKL